MFHHLECDALDHSAIQAPGDKNGKTEGDEEAESKNSILRVSRRSSVQESPSSTPVVLCHASRRI